MSRTGKMRERITEYIEENGPASTRAIFDHLSNTTKYGTTMNQLGNVLAMYFDKVGADRYPGMYSSYEIKIWTIRGDA